jgi:hypothetical protein
MSCVVLVLKIFFYSMNMVKSRLMNRSNLGSTIIGVVPKEPGDDVSTDTVVHAFLIKLVKQELMLHVFSLV